MKEIVNLAYESWEEIGKQNQHSFDSYEGGFIDGFRKARELAAKMADESSPHTGDPATSDQILQLGEREVKEI